MSSAPFVLPRAVALAVAALGPTAIGGIVAMRGGDPSPLLAVPAIVFGVIAATSPALYIATAASGDAPPLRAMVRAFGSAFGAFGIALAGLVLPAAFLALSAVARNAPVVVAGAALGGAALLGMWRLYAEIGARALLAKAVFVVWAAATLGIATRLWLSFAAQVAR